jgi:hypothetical protein
VGCERLSETPWVWWGLYETQGVKRRITLRPKCLAQQLPFRLAHEGGAAGAAEKAQLGPAVIAHELAAAVVAGREPDGDLLGVDPGRLEDPLGNVSVILAERAGPT